MAEFDHGVKQITDTTARELARVARLACGRMQPLEGTLPTTMELLADRAFRTRRGQDRFIVYFEFYTYWDRSAPWDMLAKSGLLSQRERLPTVCLAFVLLRRGFRSTRGKFRLAVAGAPTQQLWFREICLWKVEPERWWDKVPGLMALYPLCRHNRPPRDAIRHAAEAIEQTVTAQGERQDQLFLLSIFGELAYPRLDVEQIIGSNLMIQESRLGRKIRRAAKVEVLQEHLLKLIGKQFGTDLATELTSAVQAIDDPDLLEPLFDQVLNGMSLKDLRAALRVQGR